jgi:hypothetical protein
MILASAVKVNSKVPFAFVPEGSAIMDGNAIQENSLGECARAGAATRLTPNKNALVLKLVAGKF